MGRRLKAVTRALAEQFTRHNIDLQLSQRKQNSIDGFKETTWFTFIDRTVNQDYMPVDAVKRFPTRSNSLSRREFLGQSEAIGKLAESESNYGGIFGISA